MKPRTEPRNVPNSTKAGWKTELEKKGAVACVIPGCAKKFTSVKNTELHYQWCVGAKDIICPYCETEFMVANQIAGHVIRCKSKMDSKDGSIEASTSPARGKGFAALDDIIFEVTKQRPTDKTPTRKGAKLQTEDKTKCASETKANVGKRKAGSPTVVQDSKRSRRGSSQASAEQLGSNSKEIIDKSSPANTPTVRRGRPGKKSAESDTSKPKDDNKDTTTMETTNENKSESPSEGSAKKKGRGRIAKKLSENTQGPDKETTKSPKSATIENIDAVESPSVKLKPDMSVAKKRRGRPPKNQEQGEEINCEELPDQGACPIEKVKETPKRGRGRPPKQPVLESQVQAEKTDENFSPAQIENTNKDLSNSSSSEKRGRGRPPKVQVLHVADQEGPSALVEEAKLEADSTPRSRGRKRKANPDRIISVGTDQMKKGAETDKTQVQLQIEKKTSVNQGQNEKHILEEDAPITEAEHIKTLERGKGRSKMKLPSPETVPMKVIHDDSEPEPTNMDGEDVSEEARKTSSFAQTGKDVTKDDATMKNMPKDALYEETTLHEAIVGSRTKSADDNLQTKVFIVDSAQHITSQPLQSKVIEVNPSSVIQKKGNSHVIALQPTEPWKNIDYRTTVAERRHTFVKKCGRPRKDAQKVQATATVGKTYADSVKHGTPVVSSQQVRKSTGQALSTLVVVQPNQRAASKQIVVQKQGTGGALAPSNATQTNVPLLQTSPPRVTGNSQSPKSPVKIFVLPPGQNLISSTAPVSKVTSMSPVTGKPQTLTIQKISSNQQLSSSTVGVPSSPGSLPPKVVVMQSGKPAVQTVTPTSHALTSGSLFTSQTHVQTAGKPVNLTSSANRTDYAIGAAQQSTVLFVKPNQPQLSQKTTPTTKSDDGRHSDIVTNQTEKEDIAKPNTIEEGNVSASIENAEKTETDTAIDDMVAKLKESMKKNPSLAADMMSKVESVLKLNTDSKETQDFTNVRTPVDSTTEQTVPLKKRGRPPKKTKTIKNSTTGDPQDTSFVDSPSSTVVGLVEVPTTQTPPAKKRGRPRKYPLPEGSELPTKRSSPAAKKKKVKEVPVRPPSPIQDLPEPEPEFTPSGRVRRGAAKRAIQHLRDNLEEYNNIFTTEGGAEKKSGQQSLIESDNDASDIDPDVTVSSGEEEEAEKETEEDDELEEDVVEEDEFVASDVEEVVPEKKGGNKKVKIPSFLSARPSTYGRGPGAVENENMYQTAQKSLELIERLKDGDTVFTQWNTTIEQWKRITPDSDNNHPTLPPANYRVQFKIQNGKIREQVVTLERFRGTSDKGKTHLNVGGPVKAMAWCSSPFGETTEQYASIYVHKSSDVKHMMNQFYKYDSVVQLWNFGKLNQGSAASPRLSLLIQYPFGAVWNMAWCPLRAWSQDQEKGNQLPRLGLLALACSDGRIHILSVPMPKSLHSGSEEDVPLYSVFDDAVVTLDPNFSDEDSNRRQCFCLDWQMKDNCSRLIGGFADGMVHIWDLDSTSPLLHKSKGATGHGSILRPTGSHLMHQTAVTGVRFCPRNPKFIVTCSRDRYCKVWDLTMPEYPLHSHQKSENSCAEIPFHLPVFLVGNDGCFAADNKNCCLLIDMGYFGTFSRPLLPHKASNSAISYNQWSNTLASVDTGGEALVHLLPAGIRSRQLDKKCTTRRRRLFSTSCEWANGKPISVQHRTSPEMNGAAEKSKEVVETSGDYTLVYEDYDVAKPAVAGPTIQQNHLTDEDFSTHPVTAHNTICWNPNPGCHRWLASAGEAGIVRVLYISALENEKVDELLKKTQSE